MAQEDPFRIALLVVLVMTMAITAYHLVQARAAGGPVSRRAEGLVLLLLRAIFGLSICIAIVAYLVSPGSMGWSAVAIARWLRWGGVGLAFLACGMVHWTLHHLGKNLTGTVDTRAEATLVTTGPYRWVRHPFYVAVFLLLLSAFLATANWFIGVVGLFGCAVLVLRARIEEHMLFERFGDDYRAYMTRTGGFVPQMTSRR